MTKIILVTFSFIIASLFGTSILYAQSSIKFGSVSVENYPPKEKNAECSSAFAESQITRYRQSGMLDVLETASQQLLSCDVYRYLRGCTNNSYECTKPCVLIQGGAGIDEIRSYPGVADNVNDFHQISSALFRPYYIYTKAVGRFDMRMGFGLSREGKDEMSQTLSAMTCAERVSAVEHHLDTPLYFYPQKPMELTVTLPGVSAITINAFPNGAFTTTDKKTYSNLPYKLSSVSFSPPQGSLLIPGGTHLEAQLDRIAAQLEFTAGERSDFVSYWMSKLPNSNYYLVSLFDETASEKLASWKVAPQPDTEIRYIFYFKPLLNKPPQIIPNLDLTSRSVERRGFTVVDWGGIIDW